MTARSLISGSLLGFLVLGCLGETGATVDKSTEGIKTEDEETAGDESSVGSSENQMPAESEDSSVPDTPSEETADNGEESAESDSPDSATESESGSQEEATDETAGNEESESGDEKGSTDESGTQGETSGDESEDVDDSSGSPHRMDECVQNDLLITIPKDVNEDNVSVDGWVIERSTREGEGFLTEPGEEASEEASATFLVSVPCEGRWRVWVRAFDLFDSNDSLLVQVDGEPRQPIIFDTDCDNWRSQRYFWHPMHARHPGDGYCGEASGEWPIWLEQGEHEIRFVAGADNGASIISALIVTNDSEFIPEGPL